MKKDIRKKRKIEEKTEEKKEAKTLGYISRSSHSAFLVIKFMDKVGFVSKSAVLDVIEGLKDFTRIFRVSPEIEWSDEMKEEYGVLIKKFRNRLTELGVKLSQKEISFDVFVSEKEKLLAEKDATMKKLKEKFKENQTKKR